MEDNVLKSEKQETPEGKGVERPGASEWTAQRVAGRCLVAMARFRVVADDTPLTDRL